MISGIFPLGSSRPKGNGASALVALCVVSMLLLSACGGSSSGAQQGAPKVLTALGFVVGSFTQDMSPFSPNVNVGVDGLVYENLEFVNGVTGQETPMLATGHQYSADNKQLTFTIRQNVKWSDGKAFSANDVAFTFNMLQQYPRADTAGLWTHLNVVQDSDTNTVVLTFTDAVPPLLPFIEGTYIVPQHLWASVGDPTKFTNAQPVGSGPMKLKNFTAQQISYVKNGSYWQADKVKVDE